MATFRFELFSILMLSSGWAAQNFLPVSVCPRDQGSWKLESDRKKCQGDTPDYLCAAIENQVGNFGEICTKFGLTPANKCAVLNEQTHNLDSVDCKAPSGCPSQPYIPSVLWQYQICYEDFYGTTTSPAPITTQDITSVTTNFGNDTKWDGEEDVSSDGVAIAVVFIFISLIVLVAALSFFLYQRNWFGIRDKLCHTSHTDEENDDAPGQSTSLLRPAKDDFKKEDESVVVYGKPCKDESKKDKHVELEQKTEKMKELLKYLVHILKKELGVNDLKEKAVIHSKSISEHFSEKLREDLKSVKDVNDYSRLDMSLVFALLQNFCEGIKHPSRGWDYEPPDNETSDGADIERIRYMLNKYCDDDFEFKHLDKVYNRMKEKHGTVAVHGDDGNRKPSTKEKENKIEFDLMKEKIQSVKLNADCKVEKGIVSTENVITALKILKSRNVVILKGAIGCGKTHALKAVQNHFQELHKETAWVESENMLEEISNKKSTIILCDNFFGKFGSSVFSQDAVINTENVLKEIDSSLSETKVVIGIHTHVYDEVKKKFKLAFLHQKNITVEMGNLSEAETLLIFKEQLKKGHCERDTYCWFKTVGFQSVLDKLSKNQGHIGGPFLSLMYCNQHELFSDDAFSVNPVQTLMQYIEKMKHDSSVTYECLVYLMCVQQHNLEEEPKMWAGLISAEISKRNLMEVAKTSGLLHVNTKSATPAHELLTTVLFKSAIEKRELVLPVLQMCDIDILIQLLRPTDSTHSDLYLEFAYTDSNHISRNAGKMCAYRLAQKYTKQEIAHPLMEVEFIKKKSFEYLYREPKNLRLLNE